MKSVRLDLPDFLDVDASEIKILLAGELYERGKLTLGQAAKLAGYTKRAFVEIMGKYGFSIFGEKDDLMADIENA